MKVLIKLAIGALLLTLKLSNKPMGTSFIPLCAIIAVLIIAFLFASLPQVNHKTRYRVLYAIAIIMLLAVIPISEYMAEDTQKFKQQLSTCPDIRYCSRLFLYVHCRITEIQCP